MSDIKFGRYINKNSEIHKMNSFIKLMCLFMFSVLVFISNNWEMLFVLSITLFIVFLLSNISFKYLFYNFKMIIVFFIFIVVINYFSNISFIDSMFYILKLYLLILYSYVFMFSTKIKDINSAIIRILKILKVKNRNNVSITILLSFEFLPLLLESMKKIEKKNIIKSIINLINKNLKKADEISEVLYLRFYDLNESVKIQKINKRDYYILISHILLFIVRVGFI